MAISVRGARRRFHVTPSTASGWVAVALFLLALLLLFGRLVFTPLAGLPLNFLQVFALVIAAGVVALFAVAFRRDRSAVSFVMIGLGLTAAAWLMAENVAPGNPQMTLGESDNGGTFTVAQGTVITLMLEGNPTTGYSWESSIGNAAVLREANAGEFKPSSGAIGAGGTYTFQYEASAGGTTDVTLVYRRSWETGVPAVKTFHVTIVVR